MMLDEHATHAQSHRSGIQAENSLAEGWWIVSVSKNSHAMLDGIVFTSGCRRPLLKELI
jgi:hypothetical protein